jgi:hypothetical protein
MPQLGPSNPTRCAPSSATRISFARTKIRRWKLSLVFPSVEYPEPLPHILDLVRRRGWAYRATVVGDKIVPLAWRDDGKVSEENFWARWGERWPDDGKINEETWGILSGFVPNDPFA